MPMSSLYSRRRFGSGVVGMFCRGVSTSSSLPEQGVLVGLQFVMLYRSRSLLMYSSWDAETAPVSGSRV